MVAWWLITGWFSEQSLAVSGIISELQTSDSLALPWACESLVHSSEIISDHGHCCDRVRIELSNAAGVKACFEVQLFSIISGPLDTFNENLALHDIIK